jgi:hypothetical protein
LTQLIEFEGFTKSIRNGHNTYPQQWLFAVANDFVQANMCGKVLNILQGTAGEVVLYVFFADLPSP